MVGHAPSIAGHPPRSTQLRNTDGSPRYIVFRESRFVSNGWGWSIEASVALRRLGEDNPLNPPLSPTMFALGGQAHESVSAWRETEACPLLRLTRARRRRRL